MDPYPICPPFKRFKWLTPPDFTDCLKVADIVNEKTPDARGERAAAYVRDVWAFWAREHRSILAGWYAEYVA